MLGCLNASIISASWHVCNQNSHPEISICHYPFLTKIKVAKESAGLLDFVAASPSVGGFRWQLNLHCPFSEVFRTPENERCAHSTRAQEPHGGEAALKPIECLGIFKYNRVLDGLRCRAQSIASRLRSPQGKTNSIQHLNFTPWKPILPQALQPH